MADIDAQDCLDEISNLLQSWKLNDEIMQILNDRGIMSYPVLQKLEIEDVEALFNSVESKYFGEKIKFKSGLKEWRNRMVSSLCSALL